MLGMNGTSFVKNFLSFNDVNSMGSSPFQFTFRYITTSNFAMRAGLGISALNFEEKDGDNVQKVNSNSLDISIGFEKRSVVAKRWLVFGGLDLIAVSDISTSSTSSSGQIFTSKSNSSGGGAAPLFGIQFNINDRISLSTETQLRVLYTKGKETFESPGNNTTSPEETTTLSVTPILPGFIHFNVLF